MLFNLNSYSTKTLQDEYDYTTRLKAFADINSELFFNQVDTNQILPIIYNYLFFLNDNDTSIRNNASYGLSQLMKFIANSKKKLSNDEKSTNLFYLVNKILFHSITKSIKLKDPFIRKVLNK